MVSAEDKRFIMNEKKLELISVAKTIQRMHCKLLDGTSFDKLPRDSLNKLGEILCSYLPKKEAIPLSKNIIKNESELIYRILIINCAVDGELISSPVIKVKKDSQCVFYDNIGRKYNSWNNYLHHNELPKGLMIYPKNGNYFEVNGEVQIETENSPAGKVLPQIGKGMYVAAQVVNIIALSLPLFSFSNHYASQIRIASGFSNGYTAGYHAYKLCDRYKHEQSISDEDALMHWSHIGSSFLCFGFTCYASSYGNPNQLSDWDNLMTLCNLMKSEFEKKGNFSDFIRVFKGNLLSQYMLSFSEELLQKVMEESRMLGLEPILRNLLNFYRKKSSVFRELLYVDDQALSKVLQDTTLCQNINSNLSKTFEVTERMEKGIVSTILREVRLWYFNQISDIQLKFRVLSIFQYSKRAYETVEELCEEFRVDRLEDVLINNRPIFQNIGMKSAEFEELVLSASKKFPQLLSYAVEYASLHNPVDWYQFKPYFINKILEDSIDFPDTDRRPSISWIDRRTLNEVSRCNSNDGIFFVHPRYRSTVHCQDLINLGKIFLGTLSFSHEDIFIANPISGQTLLASKRKRKMIFIGHKIGEECSSFQGCYPVFVKSLL